MTIAIVEVICPNMQQGHVTLQSDKEGSLAIQELQGGSAKGEAIKAAARHGVPDPRVNGLTLAPYAVDKDGATVSDPRAQKVAAYRVDVAVTAKLC